MLFLMAIEIIVRYREKMMDIISGMGQWPWAPIHEKVIVPETGVVLGIVVYLKLDSL